MTTSPTSGRPASGGTAAQKPSATVAPQPAGASAPQTANAAPPRLPRASARVVAVGRGPKRPVTGRRYLLFRQVYRTCKFGIYAFVPIVLLVTMAIGIFYVRLRHGPIAFDFLVPPIERGINAELVNNSVKIKGAELRLGDDGQLEFRLRDLNVLESDGDTVLASPLAAVNIATAALWRGRIVPARIELIDPTIRLVYTQDAGFMFDQSAQTLEPAVDSVPQSNGEISIAEVPKPVEARRPASSQAHALNLAKLLSDSSQRARHRMGATSFLTEFGLSNATVVVEYEGLKSSWNISEASVDFNHAQQRSVISGRATISSPRGPWSLSFLTDETEKTDRLQVKAAVRDLVPSSLSGAAPPLALLRMFEFPLAGDATIDLSTAGDIEHSELALQLGQGRIAHPDLAQPFNLSAGLFKLTYDGKGRVWTLDPSPVQWTDGSMQFSGTMKDVASANAAADWRFLIDGKNGVLEAAEFGVAPIAVETWQASGGIVPSRGLVDITEFKLSGGGGQAVIKATTQAGPTGQSTIAEANLSAMPLDTLKALWPRALATGAREWVGESVSAAGFKGGSVRYLNGEFLSREPSGAGPDRNTERLSATFEIADATFVPLPNMSPLTAPRALVQLQNNALEITVPDAAITMSGNRKVPLKAGRLYAPDVMIPRPEGEITFSTQSQLAPFIEAMQQLPVQAIRDAPPLPKAGEGKVDAQFKIRMPLVSKLTAEDVSIEGKAKISDGRFGKVGGQFDVQGFTLNVDLSPTGVEAKGDLLINGVPAKISDQRVFGTQTEQQPPMKITASLDEADRTQLGLDVNDVVRGVVPIEISLQKSDRPEPDVKLKADFTDAELVFDRIAWRKPPGRAAILETDVVAGKTHKTELQNFKVSGDDIAIEGWLGIGADNRVHEFLFPAFALNVVSRLAVQGTLGTDNIWSIKANGPTFDGRDLFKSLFSVGDGQDRKGKSAKSSAGTDLNVEIGNLLGASDQSLRGFKLKISTRAEKLTKLDAKGTLESGAPVAAVVDQNNDQRRLLVDSSDAGSVMKLVDFYPNLQGGRLRLEVNLDGSGPAEKTGVLWVDDFKVLGDPIVSEVVGSADQGRPAITGNKNVKREVFEFDKLRAPFSVGYGQFVLEESYVKGPLVGANLRGKVDFKTRRINIGGTYIPLQGLNGALGGIPLLGQLISGAHGEGIFGITFAVQGALSDPQVLVNPLSLATPGILRGLMEMTTSNPKVQVREDKSPARPVEERVRASSPPATDDTAKRKTAGAKKQKNDNEVVDGWSSITSAPTPPNN